MVENNNIEFEVSISGRNDGALEAAYIRFRSEPVAKTEEIIEDKLLADYAEDGSLIGFELLQPVKLSVLTERVDPSIRSRFRKFMKEQGSLVAA